MIPKEYTSRRSKFHRVQELMRKNGEAKHNTAKQPRHSYILSGGRLWCGKCDSEMQAGAGTGRNGKKGGQIEESLASLEIAMGNVERDTIDQELVAQALVNFIDVFAELKPYQQKDLLRLVLHKAILGPDYMKMALYG